MNPIDPGLIEDVDVYRHWHPQSQTFGGGDVLATFMLLGWTLKSAVFVDTYWLFGQRQVRVFHFELVLDGNSMSVPVIGNPFVDRMIAQHDLMLVEVERPGILSAKTITSETAAVRVGRRSVP